MALQKIKRTGHSLCIILDKGVLEEIYGLTENDEIWVDYCFPEIVITAATDDNKQRKQ